MQIPLPLAEEIIGVRGQTIASIRSVSGAVVVLEETGDYLEEVLVTVEGSSSQVQTAHQLIQVNYLCPDESYSCIQSLN
jgi:poly(rC)-binding protein 2/3/4